jgi:hypothetical protein
MKLFIKDLNDELKNYFDLEKFIYVNFTVIIHLIDYFIKSYFENLNYLKS